jgi:hypothetical protein
LESRDFILASRDFNFAPRDFILARRDFNFAPRDFILARRDFNFARRDFILARRDFNFARRDSNFKWRGKDVASDCMVQCSHIPAGGRGCHLRPGSADFHRRAEIRRHCPYLNKFKIKASVQ